MLILVFRKRGIFIKMNYLMSFRQIGLTLMGIFWLRTVKEIVYIFMVPMMEGIHGNLCLHSLKEVYGIYMEFIMIPIDQDAGY